MVILVNKINGQKKEVGMCEVVVILMPGYRAGNTSAPGIGTGPRVPTLTLSQFSPHFFSELFSPLIPHFLSKNMFH